MQILEGGRGREREEEREREKIFSALWHSRRLNTCTGIKCISFPIKYYFHVQCSLIFVTRPVNVRNTN